MYTVYQEKMTKKSVLEDKDWVTRYITKWIENNTSFTVDKLQLTNKPTEEGSE